MWGKILKYKKANGMYLLIAHSFRRFGTFIRSELLAMKIGSTGLEIGPRSFIRGLAFMEIGRNFHCAEGLWLEAISEFRDQKFSPRIVIGNNVIISHWTHVAATNYIEIGDDVLIGSKVIIIDHNHGQYSETHSHPDTPPAHRTLDKKNEVIIGSNVWIGDGVVIMPGVSIGKGAVIGANSVVTHSIPEYTIALGAPAKPIKTFEFNSQEWRRVRN